MADVAPDHADETEEERRIRLRQEEMERMLLDQETEHDEQQAIAGGLLDDDHQQQQQQQQPLQQEALQQPLLAADRNDNVGNNNDLNNNNDDNNMAAAGVAAGVVPAGSLRQKLSYTDCSFLAAFVTIVYALRSRGQWYLALVYLSSSKWAFCVLGNALVALCVKIFSLATHVFLQGLRMHEAEGLQDFFRWNVTETCLALTMFRSELTVGTACEFLVLILVKCLHHVAVMRQDHLRMTDDAVQPASWNPNVPTIPWHHMRVLIFLFLLQLLDIWALHYTAQTLMASGPSVSILFAFEAAILLVSAWSHMLLWHLHVLDGWLHFLHDLGSRWGRKWLHTWKEHKATLTFAVELQAQAVQFLFYLSFFGFVLTYYGVPINLFREVYISFSALKERLVAFFKYRRLMAGMNRFANPTEEQLEEAGRVCIICRDEMTVHDCKQLPICQHLFHKSCLREWLTQQQSCPTCRSDIAAMQAQETSRNAAARAAADRQGEGEEEGGEEVPPAVAAAVAETVAAIEEMVAQETRDSTVDEKEQSEKASPTDKPSSNGTTPNVDDAERDSKPAAVTNLKQPPTSQPVINGSSTNVPQGAAAAALASSNSEEDDSSWCDLPPTPPSKGKSVRFASESPRTLSLPFPALYRVVKGDGATVWYFDEGDDKPQTDSQQQEESTSFPIRLIPLSVVVLGLKQEAKHLPELGSQKTNFVRIPDGWVSEDEILRVYTVE